MTTLYKVCRWHDEESDIDEIEVTRQTDKTVWYLHKGRERRELKQTQLYTFFETKEQAVNLINSQNSSRTESELNKRIRVCAPQLLEALELIKDKVWQHIEMNMSDEDVSRINAAIAAANGQ